MKPKLTLLILLILNFAASGTTVGQTTAPTKAPPEQKKQEQALQPTLPAAFCKIDVAKKTILVLPWDEKARTWKRDSLRVLVWNDQTLMVSGATTLTMPQFVGGKPLSKESSDVAAIQGNRGMFYITTIEGKEVVQKVEMIGLFANEPIPAVGGNLDVQILGAPGKVSCSDDDN
jgi:hypothetical protein